MTVKREPFSQDDLQRAQAWTKELHRVAAGLSSPPGMFAEWLKQLPNPEAVRERLTLQDWKSVLELDDPELVSLLLVNREDQAQRLAEKGSSLLELLTRARSAAVVDALVQAGADPNDVDPRLGQTALHMNPHPAAHARLVRLAKDVNAIDDQGHTALHVHAEAGRTAVVKHLLAAGADPLMPNVKGLRPLDLARRTAEELRAHWGAFGTGRGAGKTLHTRVTRAGGQPKYPVPAVAEDMVGTIRALSDAVQAVHSNARAVVLEAMPPTTLARKRPAL